MEKKANKLENGNYEVMGLEFKPIFNEEYNYLDPCLQPDDTYKYHKVTVKTGTEFNGYVKKFRRRLKVRGNVINDELIVRSFSGKGWIICRDDITIDDINKNLR